MQVQLGKRSCEGFTTNESQKLQLAQFFTPTMSETLNAAITETKNRNVVTINHLYQTALSRLHGHIADTLFQQCYEEFVEQLVFPKEWTESENDNGFGPTVVAAKKLAKSLSNKYWLMQQEKRYNIQVLQLTHEYSYMTQAPMILCFNISTVAPLTITCSLKILISLKIRRQLQV